LTFSRRKSSGETTGESSGVQDKDNGPGGGNPDLLPGPEGALGSAPQPLETLAPMTLRSVERMRAAEPEEPMTTFRTSREIPAAVEQVFAAISHPERLSRWWGPAGFTNTFQICEFKKGGRWSFVMHGPDGKNYPNESVFWEIESPNKVIVQHTSEPQFSLTIALAASAAGTVVSWSQAFESPDIAGRVEHIVVPANEQNLDRLTAEVLRKADIV